MPKTLSQRIVFTTTGVILMAFTMALFNKSLIYGFTPAVFKEALIGFAQKAPLAWILQFFLVQKFAGKMTAKYPTDNKLLYYCIRTGFSVIIMCPVMSLFSNVTIAMQHYIGWDELVFNWLPKMVVNWPFAFFVQIFLLGPLNRFLFSAIYKQAKPA